jgi:hypothetical protein
MPSLNIQRNDRVAVIAGSDRGKQGRVLRVIPETNRVLVERDRGAGSADPCVERDAGLSELRTEPGGSQVRG